MASINFRTLPPGASIVAVEKTITKANIGGNYIGWPFIWTAGFNAGITDLSGAESSWGFAYSELANQYQYCGIMKTFYPNAARLYDQTSKVGSTTMHNFLRLLDFWYSKGINVMWSPGLFVGTGAASAIWAGYPQNGVGGNNGEQALVNFFNDIFGSYASTTANDISAGSKTFTIPTGLLLTSLNKVKIYQTSNTSNFVYGDVTSYTSGTGALVVNITSTGGSGIGITDWSVKHASPLGFTLAEHPALTALQVSNESVINTATAPEYARAVRIATKLMALYKPAVKIIHDGAKQGSQYMSTIGLGSAVTINGITTNGDDGTGKQAVDYSTNFSANYYTSGADTAVLHATAITNNTYSNHTKGVEGKFKGAIENLTNYRTAAASHISGLGRAAYQYWATEISMVLNIVSPNAGGWNMFMASRLERYYNLIRWYLPILFSTQDGSGGLGVAFFYAFDGSGAANGSSGTYTASSVAAHSDGSIKLTLSGSPAIPWSGTVTDQSIVITAGSGGWSDLGLSSGQKARYVMSQVSGNTVNLQGTTFTAQPSNNGTYTEYQVDWAPNADELKMLTDNLFNYPVSFGYIRYPGAAHPGVWVNFKGLGTFYTKSNGVMAVW